MGKQFDAAARRRIVTALATGMLGTALAFAAGCGGDSRDVKRAGTTAAAAPTESTSTTAVRFRRERELFRTHCGACHTLADAGAHGTKAGGEALLDEIEPNRASTRNFIVNGYGAMPSFRKRLSRREIDALAFYVAEVDGCGNDSPIACDGD